MAWLEVVGGLLGVLGSLVLAIPPWKGLDEKAFWEDVKTLKSIRGVSPADIDRLEERLIDRAMSGYRLHARCNVVGSGLLFFGFVLIAATGLSRL
jgi:hypothetical protein